MRVSFTCFLHMVYFCSLKYINVAMVTVLKNVTNVITAVGEMYLFSKDHDSRVWAALFLMVSLVAQNVLWDSTLPKNIKLRCGIRQTTPYYFLVGVACI